MEQEKDLESVYEIAILGRVTWQLHSLNNEGAVGNVTEPRSVRIIDPKTKKAVTTDGISGEMLKHIHTEIMWTLTDKNKLCDACKVLNPEKFNFAIKSGKLSVQNVENALERALKTCDICDVHGFLLEKPTVSRKSTVEFGWALGIPEVYRDIHTHARHSISEIVKVEEEKEPGNWGSDKCSKKGCETKSEESKLLKVEGKWYCEEHAPVSKGQMVYHRPTRSGIYAVVSVFQPWRIGLNEARQECYTYDVNNANEDRKRRYQIALKAYQIMFARPEGAMTTTRFPHVEDFNGVIVYSTKPIPVPVISPLKDNYIEEIEKIVSTIGKNPEEREQKEASKEKEGPIKVLKFESISCFVNKMNDLLKKQPYILDFGKKGENK
ncbi:MAG: DevR family CRISPR-associated autoregulator [Archaeoglobaceae archaeon]